MFAHIMHINPQHWQSVCAMCMCCAILNQYESECMYLVLKYGDYLALKAISIIKLTLGAIGGRVFGQGTSKGVRITEPVLNQHYNRIRAPVYSMVRLPLKNYL